ncbi:hypothetical protein [Absidia glauca]|uniref:Uncharacterized protein n=1 Tax=Absidia glauca TaxID=4829 RepID=A0A163JJP7_ABSGL|nr:hypothetical protein [Absidia glauca]
MSYLLDTTRPVDHLGEWFLLNYVFQQKFRGKGQKKPKKKVKPTAAPRSTTSTASFDWFLPPTYPISQQPLLFERQVSTPFSEPSSTSSSSTPSAWSSRARGKQPERRTPSLVQTW